MGWFTTNTDPVNATWEKITAGTGSIVQDAINFMDNAFLHTLSKEQQALIDQENIDQINRAAAGNKQLATNETNQYLSDVNNAVYKTLPTGVEDTLAKIEKYLPWIAGGLLVLYIAPTAIRLGKG